MAPTLQLYIKLNKSAIVFLVHQTNAIYILIQRFKIIGFNLISLLVSQLSLDR